MKEKIKSILTLAITGASLAFALRGSGSGAAPLSVSPPVAVLPSAAPAASPAEAYRAYRLREREREQAALQALLADAEAPEAEREQARRQLLALQENAETELAVEAALAARGDGEGLCVRRSGEITVFLSRALTEAEAALILEIAKNASGIGAGHIRISAF